jgi:hypothetical protein
MKINEAYQNFDVKTMERLLEVDPMLQMAKRALDELGENRIEGLKVLYRTYVLGEMQDEVLSLPS